MADSPNRTPRARRTRGSSRVNSARSSAVFDEPHPSYSQYQQGHYEPSQARVPSTYEPQQARVPSGGYSGAAPASYGQLQGGPSHGLRPMESRFSLNEHFAATRREYEFGDEDVVSVFDRGTVSDVVGEGEVGSSEEHGDEGVGGAEEEVVEGEDEMDADFYEVLCLPGDGASSDEVRRAYWRWFGLLYPDNHEPDVRDMAEKYFERVQVAFETLSDPKQRAAYDFALRSGYEPGSEEFGEVVAEALGRQAKKGLWTGSDLGVRFDASSLVRRLQGEVVAVKGQAPRPLDFTVGHHITVGVPALGDLVKSSLRQVQEFMLAPPEDEESPDETKVPMIALESAALDSLRDAPVFIVPTPSLTVTGSVFGVAEDMSQMPMALLSDRYQPLLPLSIPRRRVIQLVENRLCPLVTMRVHQNIHRATSDAQSILSSTAVELESDILPRPALTARVAHSTTIHGAPTTLGSSVTALRGPPSRAPLPRVCLWGQRATSAGGTAFARLDSGDWTLKTEDTCKFFTEFSRINRRFFYAEFPVRTPASFEVGYKTTPCERGSASSGVTMVAANHNGDVPAGEAGIRGLDEELDVEGSGSWAVSLSATADSLGSYLRYGRDIATLIPWRKTKTTRHRPARLEAELCATTLLDRYFAIRSLLPVGKSSRLGFELGISAYSIHFSLYWSRLHQRLSLLLFLTPRTLVPARKLLYCAAIPFLVAGCMHFLALRKQQQQQDKDKSKPRKSKRAVRRAEADDLTFLLHRALSSRDGEQQHRSRAAELERKLTILSAKYGAATSGWAGEDVADVTVALAALVRGGRCVVIPAGLRISRLPGFWDPAPGREKVLRVRYGVGGREGVVEVRDGERVVIP